MPATRLPAAAGLPRHLPAAAAAPRLPAAASPPGGTPCRRRRRAPSLPRPQSSASGLLAVATILRERRCSSGRPIVRFAPRRRPLDADRKK